MINDESNLIYCVDDIFTKYISGEYKFFNIPEYQRGYKWTEGNVIQLLEDLKAFKKVDDEFYCLQNITLAPALQDGESYYNVIDGQQRLTTLFILVSYLKYRNPNEVGLNLKGVLKYSVRKSTDAFLQDEVLTGKVWLNEVEKSEAKHKDEYYIIEVAQAIKKWFDAGNEILVNRILYDLKLIVNRVDKQDEEVVFASLNGGKVDLDGSDLLRAIMITRAAKQKYPKEEDDIKVAEFRVRLGVELDEVARWWSQKEVILFFEQLLPNELLKNKSFQYSKYAIDLLYDCYYVAYKDKMNVGDLSGMSVRCFENGIDLNNHIGDDHFELYQSMMDMHYTLKDWYEDKEIYHLLGYLFFNFKANIDFKKIWDIWIDKETKDKTAFRNRLKLEIGDILVKRVVGEEDSIDSLGKQIENVNYDWYNNDMTNKLLPLLDIIILNSSGNERLDVHYFKVNNEDKEHIRSQTPQYNPELTKDEREKEIKDNEHGLNSIGNLVLLDLSINRSYGNANHIEKMKKIMNEYIEKKRYIRPHTFSVFMEKVRHWDENNINSGWTDNEISQNSCNVYKQISEYLCLGNVKEVAHE